MGGLRGSPLLSPQVSELGLEPLVLPVAADHPASRHRFLYANGALHRMPSGLGWVPPPYPPIPPSYPSPRPLWDPQDPFIHL